MSTLCSRIVKLLSRNLKMQNVAELFYLQSYFDTNPKELVPILCFEEVLNLEKK